MLQRFAIVSVAVAMFLAAPAWAQCKPDCPHAKQCAEKDKQKDDSKGCCEKHGAQKDEKSAMCSSDVTCDGDRVRYEGVEIPRIGFKVGDTVTCCMKSATEMAKGDKSKIKFVVADKTYDDLNQAQAARLELLEDWYNNLLTVKYAVGDECVGCPIAAKQLASKSGKEVHYRLAKFDFADKAAAEKAAQNARAAADKVTMTWSVGDKSYNCPKQAGQVAESTGKKVEYCVGESRTPCETTAKTRLIEARITAALEVLAKAQKT
jgi:hypothetical protein